MQSRQRLRLISFCALAWAATLVPALFAQTAPKLTVGEYRFQDRSHIWIWMELDRGDADMPAYTLSGKVTFTCGGLARESAAFRRVEATAGVVLVELSEPLPPRTSCTAAVDAVADFGVNQTSPPLPTNYSAKDVAVDTTPRIELHQETFPGRFGLRVLLQANYPVDMRRSADYRLYEVTYKEGDEPRGNPWTHGILIPDTSLYDRQTPEVADRIGSVAILLLGNRLTTASPVLKVEGFISTLDEDLEFVQPKKYDLGSAPKSKEAAYAYVGVSHQAGAGAKPGTALDLKFAPLLTRTWGLVQGPTVNADLLWNTISGLKSEDTARFGWRAERFVRFAGAPGDEPHDPLLAGIRLVPAVYLETNRARTNRNVVGDVSAQYFFRGLYNPQAVRTRRAYLDRVDDLLSSGPPIKIGDFPLEGQQTAKFGWNVGFHTGYEFGGSLMDVTVKAKDRSAVPQSITLPTFAVSRLKAKTQMTFEIGRFELSGFAEMRYLLAAENVARETLIEVPPSAGASTKAVVLGVESVDGLQPSFEARVRYRIDPFGRYTFETTFKNGAVPPGFIYANTYRSGLVVQY